MGRAPERTQRQAQRSGGGATDGEIHAVAGRPPSAFAAGNTPPAGLPVENDEVAPPIASAPIRKDWGSFLPVCSRRRPRTTGFRVFW